MYLKKLNCNLSEILNENLVKPCEKGDVKFIVSLWKRIHKYLFSMYDALNEVLGNRDILVMKSDQNYILGRSERKQKSNKTFGYVG